MSEPLDRGEASHPDVRDLKIKKFYTAEDGFLVLPTHCDCEAVLKSPPQQDLAWLFGKSIGNGSHMRVNLGYHHERLA